MPASLERLRFVHIAALAVLLLGTQARAFEDEDARYFIDTPSLQNTLIESFSPFESTYTELVILAELQGYIFAYGDPSSCYRFSVTNPIGSGSTTVKVDIEIPVPPISANQIHSSFEIELIDSDTSGTASITRRNGFPGLQRALLFTDDSVEFLSDLGEVDLDAAGKLEFESGPTAGPTTTGNAKFDLIMTFLLSEGDTAVLSGRVIIDEGTEQPVCDIPILFDHFETGDLRQWSSVVGAAR